MSRDTNWRRYLAVGVLSLLKALAVRGNRTRMRTELTDAGLFLGLAALVRYVEGDAASERERPSVLTEAARRMRTQDGRPPLARLDEYLDEPPLQQYRQHVPSRLSGENGDSEPTTLRERIRIR